MTESFLHLYSEAVYILQQMKVEQIELRVAIIYRQRVEWIKSNGEYHSYGSAAAAAAAVPLLLLLLLPLFAEASQIAILCDVNSTTLYPEHGLWYSLAYKCHLLVN